MEDGITKQAEYSFTKEEWHTDTLATALGDDNLIRHEFPWEPITSEQMEIGGGTSHADWVYFNIYTRKKIRTGGWAAKNTATSTISEYAGMISLGAMDSDAQAYYQQVSTQNPPVDFTFLGAVNEPVNILSSGADAATFTDYRTYFKAFLRKKGKTYASYDLLTEQNISQLTYRLYSFPLTHTTDAAITDSDARVIGAGPFHSAASVITDTDGITSVISSTESEFRSPSLATFTSVLVAGDTVFITGTQTDAGYYTITSVTDASTCKVDTTEAGILTGATGLDYDIFTRIRSADKTGGLAGDHEDAQLSAGVSAAVAIVSSNNMSAVTDGVVAGDVVAITSSTSDHEGVYAVISVVSENTLQVDSTDNPFTDVTGVDFKVYTPGMFMQYKKEVISISAHGSIHFDKVNPAFSSAPTIARDTGTWSGDGVTEGTVLVFGSTVSNDRSYTVASVVNASTVTCVPLDASTMVDEIIVGASTTSYDGFKRTINNVVYSFNWKLLANGNTALNCYQFTQHQYRQTTDIDWGQASFRGDVTDQALAYATPTGVTTNLHIDNIDADDTNNVTYYDSTGISRAYPFVTSFTINHNDNMQNDAACKVRAFYTTNPTGDYGSKNAVTVINADGSSVAYNVTGAASKQQTWDYDGNTDGGRSAGTDADVTFVGIGKTTAQFVKTEGTLTRAKGLSFSLVAPLERNYSNP